MFKGRGEAMAFWTTFKQNCSKTSELVGDGVPKWRDPFTNLTSKVDIEAERETKSYNVVHQVAWQLLNI